MCSQGQFCDYCNSLDPNKAHPVTNAIDGTERWWQSPPLSRGMVYNEVNVTLDLGQVRFSCAQSFVFLAVSCCVWIITGVDKSTCLLDFSAL